MIAICPACGARFEIETAAVPAGGRDVRCGKCGHVWHFSPEDAAEETASPVAESEPVLPEAPPGLTLADEAAEAPGPAAAAALPAAQRPRALLLGWLALAVFVAAVLAGGWFGRDALVAAVPQTARVYALLGLQAAGPAEQGMTKDWCGESDLEVADLRASSQETDDRKLLLIEGTVVNRSAVQCRLPELQAVVRNPQGELLAEWSFSAAPEVLPAGTGTNFDTSNVVPSDVDLNINVVLAKGAERQ